MHVCIVCMVNRSLEGGVYAIVSIANPDECDCASFRAGVEMFKKSLDQGQAGDNVGILLRSLKREDVLRGQVMAAPGTIKTYKKFKGEVYVLKQDEGGRHTPFFSNYRCAPLFVLSCRGSIFARMRGCIEGRDKQLWNLIS